MPGLHMTVGGRLILWLAVVMAAGGCAGGRTGAGVITDHQQIVRLVTDPTVNRSDPSTHHMHPLRLSLEATAAILRGVEVQERRGLLQSAAKGSSKRDKAFRESEILKLTPLVQEHLSKASPFEKVVFYLSQTTEGQYEEVTSGAMFVHGDRLHVILANHRYLADLSQGGSGYGPNWPELPIAQQEYDLFFAREDLGTKPAVGTWARWFRAERPELMIDYGRLLMTAEQTPSATSGPAENRSSDGALLSAAVPVSPVPPAESPAAAPVPAAPAAVPVQVPVPAAPAVSTPAPKGSSAKPAAPPAPEPIDQTQVLSKQLALLQELLEQKAQEIKDLTKQLGAANQTLAAKEAEITQLKAARKRPAAPKKPAP